MLLSFTEHAEAVTQFTKVLMTTGWDVGTQKIEVFDLSDSTNVCQRSGLVDYHFDEVSWASGGLLNNNIALVCGGYKYSSPDKRLDDCLTITDNGVEAAVKLIHPRSEAASVVFNGDTLWLTGGSIIGMETTKTTEFVTLTGTRPGPDLPLELEHHCLVTLNDTTVLLIGGEPADLSHSKATFYYNTEHQTWTEGPSLITGRFYHGCALFKSHQHGQTDTVIVTGGWNREALATTEFLNLDGSNVWTLGM
jgi:hypothetical protein